MQYFVEFQSITGRPVLIEPSTVTGIEELERGGTMVVVGHGMPFVVREDLATVRRELERALRIRAAALSGAFDSLNLTVLPHDAR